MHRNLQPVREVNDSMVFEKCTTCTSALPQKSIPSSSKRSGNFAVPMRVSSPPLSQSSHLNSAVSDGITSSKHSYVERGGVVDPRRPRLSSSQTASGNLTLAQLNTHLAKALVALKAGSDASTKSTGISSNESSESCCEILASRMSGPVTLESLAPASSKSPDGSALTSSHVVSFKGQTIEVPEKIFCHLCDYPMKLSLRKTKYKGGIRLYPAYRCLRKGCQTYRSVRSVIEADDSHRGGWQGADFPTGTLIYVNREVTPEQMKKMLEFDFKFFTDKPAPKHFIPRPLFGRLNMSVSEMDEHLETEQGQKEIQQHMMRFRQPSPPPCIIEAAERWEAMALDEQWQVHSAA